MFFKEKSAQTFIADFEKGDSLIRDYRHYTRMFRYPFLKEGNTVEDGEYEKIPLENAIKAYGHK